MKYDQTTADELKRLYLEGIEDADITKKLAIKYDVSERSIIAKLSSMDVYRKKPYLNKRGELPQKKSELIERLAEALDVNLELLESLEKANKNVLLLLLKSLEV